MKKLLICLLLLPSLAWGQEYARMNPYILGSGVAAAASAFCYDATHTTANSGTAVRLCEDMESSTSCFTGGDSYCRVTWTIGAGSPDDTVAAIDGAHSMGIDTAGAATEYIEYDTGANSATLGLFAKVKVVALPTAARGFLSAATTSAQGGAELDNNGTLIINFTSRATGTTNKMTAGNTYYVWVWYDASSGASDGIGYACFSTTTTRPANPSTDTDYCSYKSDHNVTADVDRFRLVNGYSASSGVSYIIDDIVVSTSEIGSNP